jgi:PAS domain S-box-containing protein
MAASEYVQRFVHPDDWPIVQQSAEGTRTGTEPEVLVNIEHRVVRRDGEIRHIVVRMRGFRDATGRIVRAFGANQDITERKEAEKRLRESEERYRIAIEHSNDGVALLRQDRYIYVNHKFLDIFGYSRPEEVVGTRIDIVVHPDDRRMVAENNHKRCRGEPAPSRYEFKGIRKDGERIFLEVSVASINYQGESALLVYIRDITERKRGEEALMKSEKRYRDLFENASEAVFVAQNGKVVFHNPSTSDMFGYPGEGLAGRHFTEHIHPDDRDTVLQRHKRRVEGEDLSRNYVFRIIRRDGSIRWVELNTVVIDWEGKGATLNFLSDTTDRKEAEEKLESTLTNLRRAIGGTIQAIVQVVEMRDPYTAGHQRRVADLARSIATYMHLPFDMIEGVRIAAVIHDIGKISVPAEILSKPGKLTRSEFELIKEHPQAAYAILKDVEFPWPIAEIIYQHHERLDGSGYPRGLGGKDVLLESQIIAVADVVEALASHRPYRPAHGIEAALHEITNNRGILYDPKAVDACLGLFKEKGYRFG